MLRDRLAATRFQLDDVSARCGVRLGMGAREGMWVVWQSLFKIPVGFLFFADGTRHLLQAPYHCYTGFFTQGAATQPTTGAQAQCRQTNEDDILENDVQ